MTTTEMIIVASPLLASTVAGVAAMLLDAFVSRRAAVIVASVLLAVSAGLAIWQSFEPLAAIMESFLAGGIVSAVWAVVSLTAALSLFGGLSDLSSRKGGGGVAALVALATAGSMLLASSLDLVMTLIALETIAVCCYAIVVAGRTAASAEAAMKYVIQGAVATGLYLAGLAIHVGVTGGGSDLGRVAAGMPEFALASTAATVFLLAAFAFKLGAVPFHSWAPDALETAPPSGSAFMASAPKIAAVLGLTILFSQTVEQVAIKTLPTLNHVILFATLAVGSILVGNLAGLPQTSYLRMLAYSGIAQVGYVLIGLATGSGAFPATIFLVSVYGLAALGAFLAAQFVRAARPRWDGSISGMAGLGREHPVVAVGLAVLLLSLTGIPLTAGFWGKLYVFNFAVRAGLEWLVLLGVLGSVVSFGYYGAVLRSVFFDTSPAEQGSESDPDVFTTDRAAAGVVLACASAILVLGFLPLFLGLLGPLAFFGYQ